MGGGIPGFKKIAAAVVGLVLTVLSFGAFELNDAKHIMVIQVPTGGLHVYNDAGVKPQWWGKVTTYPKRAQFSFSSAKDQGGSKDESIKVRFNDGGHANVSGVANWEMPVAVKAVIEIHTKFGSELAVEQQLIRPTLERAIYLSGPMLSSTESYAARRNELLFFIEDQARLGIYETDVVDAKKADPITGQEKSVQIVKLRRDEKGLPRRQSQSPFAEFEITLLPLTVNDIKYDKQVEDQIQAQQRAIMQVQTAAASAREAEQRAITAEKNGQADAAKAKWDQEVIKAKEVTAAEQRKAVARLDAEAAEQKKREQILLGEGEAARKQLVMSADGALDKKLDAWVKSQEFWAKALAAYQGDIVPRVAMGQNGHGPQATGIHQLMELIGAKTASDLAVDLRASGREQTQQKK